jgi:CRP-like cAMP-binding protein
MKHSSPKQNHLLAALPEAEWTRWLPQLLLVELTLGQVLYEPGRTMTHAYFPTTAIVSMLYVMQNGESAEIAVVGYEGLIGIPLFMGGDSTSSRAVVQNAGRAYRISAKALKQEFREAAVLHLLLRFTAALMTQMVQTAACNKHHTLKQQLSRWLLLSLDRLPSNKLAMTQQLISNMLGVKLEVVLEAEKKLQADHLIRFSDGDITVTNRPGLEMASCECYLAVKQEYARLLPDRIIRSPRADVRPSALNIG